MLIKDAAREAAEQTIASYWQAGQFPVDPYRIAERLGLTVVESHLDDDISGMVVKLPGRDAEILLEEDDSQERKTFSCAHELGHWMERTMLSSMPKDFAIIEKRGGPRDAHEFYADEFAGNLLMPTHAIERWVSTHSSVGTANGHIDLLAIAKEFGVSVSAARVRLQRLEYPV